MTINSITIKGLSVSFVVAAITLGQLDEDPFTRDGKKPARIIITDPSEANQPFDMEVSVDRGFNTYVHPLPTNSPDEFLQDDFKGWGQQQNVTSREPV